MNLISFRVLFKKGLTTIKRFQFQAKVVSCEKETKTTLVNMKQNPVIKEC